MHPRSPPNYKKMLRQVGSGPWEKATTLTRSLIRLGFCLAVAVLAAAFADPVVEYASNAGLFGRGNFTDRSNLDVLPALTIGTALVVILVILRVRVALREGAERTSKLLRASREALGSRIPGLLPLAFALQISVLYLMETAEQFVVYGHSLGPIVWIGGPPALSLGFHAVVCALVALGLARAVGTCTSGTLRVIGLIRSNTTILARDVPPPRRRREAMVFASFAPLLCRIGERAPPLPST